MAGALTQILGVGFFVLDGVAEKVLADRQTEHQSPDVKKFAADRQDNKHDYWIQPEVVAVDPRVEYVTLDHVDDPNSQNGEENSANAALL